MNIFVFLTAILIAENGECEKNQGNTYDCAKIETFAINDCIITNYAPTHHFHDA